MASIKVAALMEIVTMWMEGCLIFLVFLCQIKFFLLILCTCLTFSSYFYSRALLYDFFYFKATLINLSWNENVFIKEQTQPFYNKHHNDKICYFQHWSGRKSLHIFFFGMFYRFTSKKMSIMTKVVNLWETVNLQE